MDHHGASSMYVHVSSGYMKKEDPPSWLETLVNDIPFEVVVLTPAQASLKGLASCLRNEMSTKFNWIDLAVTFTDQASSRPSLDNFRKKLMEELPSLQEKVFNVTLFCAYVPRLSCEVLRTLAQFGQSKPVVKLDFFKQHQQRFLMEPKKKATGEKDFLTAPAQLLVVKRICQAAAKAGPWNCAGLRTMIHHEIYYGMRSGGARGIR